MKNFSFERKYLIKNLFNSKEVLNFFTRVEFESLNIYLFCLEKDLIKADCKQELILPVTSESLPLYRRLNKESKLFDFKNINFSVYPEHFEEFFYDEELKSLFEKKFFITLNTFPNKEFVGISLEKNKDWIMNNPIYIKTIITKDNYKEIVQKMILFFRNKNMRFYDLKFDYISLQDMKISELTELEFWLNYFCVWCRQDHPHKIEIRQSSEIVRPIYVSDNLELFLDDTKDNISFIFDLGSNMEKNGEHIDIVSLNKLRQYTDLMKRHLDTTNKFNFNLINFRDNIMINGFINEVPWITSIVNSIVTT
jgi:hypothetical protein